MVETPTSADAPHVAPHEPVRRHFLSRAVAESSAFLPVQTGQTGKTARDSESLSDAGFLDHYSGNHFLDPNGVAVTKQALASGTTLVNFVFTGCATVCPVQPRALTDLHSQLKPDIKGGRFITGLPQDRNQPSNSLRLFHEGTGPSKREVQSTALCLADIHRQIRARFKRHSPQVTRRAREIHALDRVTQVAPQQAPLQAST